MDDYSVKLREKQDDSGAAQLFSLTARLPEKGNTDTILAASKRSLRMGFVIDPEQDPLGRINAVDLDFDAYTPANKSDTLVLSETAIFP